MKYKRSAGLLLSSILLFVGAPTAMAHELPSPTPVPSVAPLSELGRYKLAYEHYLRDEIKYGKISDKFKTAVDKAKIIFEAAMATAKSDKVRTIIQDRFDSSIKNAINIRDAAIEEMGGAPVEPEKPVKPQAAATTKKTKPNSPSPTP